MFIRPGVSALAAWAFFCNALWVSQFASAAAIVGSMQEPFDYATGTLFPNPSTLNGGAGFNATGTMDSNAAVSVWGSANNAGAAAGTNRTATTPGLTSSAIGYLAGSGNKLTLDAVSLNATQNIGRTLGGQSIDSGTTYFSLLMSKNNETNRTINWAFFNDAGERFAIGQIGGQVNNLESGTFGMIGLLMNNQNPAGLVVPAVPAARIAMGVGITHLLVGKIEWNAAGFENVSLWVDPSSVTTEAAAGAVYVSTNLFELTNLTRVRPFAGNTVTQTDPDIAPVSANFDEFRLGGTWESVTSQPVPVPEPTTLLLAGVGAIGLTISARRRKVA